MTQYTLEQDIKYDTFKIDGSVDDYLDNAIESYLKYKTQLIQLNKDYYNDKSNYVSISSAKFEISTLTDDKQLETDKEAADASNF